MIVIKLLPVGCDRVLDSEPGMTFIVDKLTPSPEGDVAHVRDYRYTDPLANHPLGRDFQIWSIPNRGYEIVKE